MKRDDAYRRLSKILSDEHLILHDECWREIKKLVFGTGQEVPFLKKLTRRIDKLLREGNSAIGTEGIEKLSNASDLYSMHVDTQTLNIRILFAFRSRGTQLLLLAFHEREGKKSTDYSNKIPLAQQRLENLNI